jgi:hypothetical protein
MDVPLETGFDKLWDEARMIDMSVGQDDRVNQSRFERERPVIQLLLGLRPLKHAAIDHGASTGVFKHKARPGDRSGRAIEM